MIRYEGRSPKHTKKEKEKDTLFDRIKKIGNRTNSGDFSEANKNGINPNCKENWYMFMSKAIVAQTIEEISSYMAQIKLDPHNSTQIILQLFKTYNIKNNDVIQLVEAQQRRLIFEKNKTFFLRKGEKEKKSSLIFAFQKAIVYLDWKKDKLFEFLRLSKDFQKELKPIINWLILYNYKQDADQKIKIWIQILNPVKFN